MRDCTESARESSAKPNSLVRLIRKTAFALTSVFLLAACSGAAASGQNPLVGEAAQSLINRHTALLGGWAWQSVIQAPNYQTDRDVGTASIGTSFLQMYDATGKASYLTAAEEAGNWLVAAQTSAGWWPDYVNPSNVSPGGPAKYGFTSLDDGVIGQASFLLALYQKTGNAAYQASALKGINWLLSVAEAPSGKPCPSQQCYWDWWVPAQGKVYLGLGSGVAGIFYGLDQIAQTTGNASYENYALAAAAYEETQIASSGAVPEVPGGATYDTGLYQGGAGVAVAYLSLYQHTGNTRWLTDANKIMAWVRSQEKAQSSGIAWPISVGTGGNKTLSTEIAEGAAGIGWAELQAYKLTHAAVDLQTAEAAGTWLLSVQTAEGSGDAWQAYLSGADANDYYMSEDLGVSGIGYFFNDLYLATGIASYNTAAQNAAGRLQASTFNDAEGASWYQDDCIGCGGWRNRAEPSYNWGIAGIGAFGARLSGGPDDMPRDVSAIAGDVYSIGAGQAGPVGSYTADADASGSNMGTDSVTHAIDMSGVTFQSPAPSAIYQGERYGSSFSYTLPNLTAGKSYTVRLHFAETYYTTSGGRQFNVVINGKLVLTNFDIVVAAGAGFKANIQTFTATASSAGVITIQFTQGHADWPKVSGVEVY
ncbi:MAG: malectin domain-containing carbohydrate-binding protein [Terracidiphilus sp.]